MPVQSPYKLTFHLPTAEQCARTETRPFRARRLHALVRLLPRLAHAALLAPPGPRQRIPQVGGRRARLPVPL